MKVGDIAILWSNGIRRLIVDSRDEIVPKSGNWSKTNTYHVRTVFRLAGDEYSNDWFTEGQISSIIPR